MQTRLQSLVEGLFNTSVGFFIAVISQILVFPFYGLEVTFSQHISLTLIFTCISVLRGYFVRRLFNTIGNKDDK